MSLKRLFQFSKPKTPGYGLSKGFYISVLSGHAQLPSPNQVVNPGGEGGAVEGFLAPLMANASKEDLGKPMERGVYAVATKDRKTVLRLRVVSKEEAGFDPEPIASSVLALTLAPETLARIRATWALLQFTFESHDPMVTESLRFLFDVARRMADLTEGVVADPMAQRYLLPTEVPTILAGATIESVDHIAVRMADSGGKPGAFTLGMQKFGLPEFELNDLPDDQASLAAMFLLSLCQTYLSGKTITAGDRAGSRTLPFEVAAGGLDRARWEGIPVLELLPPTGRSVSEALAAWRAESSAS